MRSRIATCLGIAAILAACAGDDNGSGAPGVVTPPPSAGAAGGGAAVPPAAMNPPAANPPMAMNNPPAAMNPPSQNPPAMNPPSQNPPSMNPPAMNPPTMNPPTMNPVPQDKNNMQGAPLAMDECKLMTKYIGDEFCINPPPADKGFQMRIGPGSHDSPESRYLLQPGGEVTENFSVTSGNTSQIYYYWRQYRMRPGSHHLIITEGAGRRLGGSSNAAKDNPEGGVIAPENKGVGMPLNARTNISNSLHYFNFTDKPVLKEVWVNFWYRNASEVTEPTREIFSMLSMGIAPGQNVNVHGTCNITSPGRLLTTYGHVHANNQRFSVWRTRGADKMLVHEAYDWEHPNISEFSSTVTNPMLNPMGKKDGGFTGIVDLKAGDKVEFECQILNDTNKTFVGLNEAEDDEMCIMIGDTVGTTIPGLCTRTQTPVAGGAR